KTIKLLTRNQTIFSKFLVGKVLDSLIIGIIAFVCLSLFKMPYTELVSFIIGVTNIIPFFGPFIGAIPSFIIILFVSPVKALWFLLFIFLLQQLDGNYIGPKILG
ncbi:AI-2E family transporter, partial [Proteiniclasticum sp.]|uniref:AI-2E family transporter n=1 Tax=Proteiniclasticum sp. TaxID=2053595 RepID=UPI002898A979